MRSMPTGWNTVWTKLGFRRSRSGKQRRSLGRKLSRFECLEPRQMLAGVVTTHLDVVANDGVTSLREAVAGGGLITFDQDLLGRTIQLSSQLGINAGTTIQGPGAGQLTIAAAANSRALVIAPSVAATISGVTITGGNVTGGGGGGLSHWAT